MALLGKDELSCLQALAQGRGQVSCRSGVLLSLLRDGLVLQRPVRSLPLENMAYDYVLSPAGKLVLERHAKS